MFYFLYSWRRKSRSYRSWDRCCSRRGGAGRRRGGHNMRIGREERRGYTRSCSAPNCSRLYSWAKLKLNCNWPLRGILNYKKRCVFVSLSVDVDVIHTQGIHPQSIQCSQYVVDLCLNQPYGLYGFPSGTLASSRRHPCVRLDGDSKLWRWVWMVVCLYSICQLCVRLATCPGWTLSLAQKLQDLALAPLWPLPRKAVKMDRWKCVFVWGWSQQNEMNGERRRKRRRDEDGQSSYMLWQQSVQWWISVPVPSKWSWIKVWNRKWKEAGSAQGKQDGACIWRAWRKEAVEEWQMCFCECVEQACKTFYMNLYITMSLCVCVCVSTCGACLEGSSHATSQLSDHNTHTDTQCEIRTNTQINPCCPLTQLYPGVSVSFPLFFLIHKYRICC